MKLKVKDEKLMYNGAECLKCGDIITSTDRHDFKSCKCGAIFVDGGYEYARAGADTWANFKSLSKYESFVRDETKYEEECRLAGRPLSYVNYVDEVDPNTNLPVLTSL